jgi:hypothetical protein
MYVCVCMHVYEHVYVLMGFQGVQFWFLKTKQTKREYVCMCIYVYVCMYEYAYAFMVFLRRCSLLVSKIQRANCGGQQGAGMRCGTTKATRKSDACACEKLLFNYQLTRWVQGGGRGVVWGQEE